MDLATISAIAGGALIVFIIILLEVKNIKIAAIAFVLLFVVLFLYQISQSAPQPKPSFSVGCRTLNSTAFTCSGYDTSNKTKTWNVQITQGISTINQPGLDNKTFNGSSFNATYTINLNDENICHPGVEIDIKITYAPLSSIYSYKDCGFLYQNCNGNKSLTRMYGC